MHQVRLPAAGMAFAVAFALNLVDFSQAGSSPSLTVANTSEPSHAVNSGFVTTRDGRLYLNSQPFYFRGMNAPNLFEGSEFNAVDTFQTFAGMGTAVTRTYIILQVKNDQWGGSTDHAHAAIVGYDSVADDWAYNEDWFSHCDMVLNAARQYGIKIIIPFVNQDFGDASTNFKGNFVDLIRYRYNLSSYSEAQRIDWWTDPDMRSLFKKAIAKMLTRVNTRNGIVWGDDDSILAWETGNEMNQATQNNTIHRLPAPANWTLDIAEFTKSLAPRTLLMDGSYSRTLNLTTAWPTEVIQSQYVDILSYHFYGDGDIAFIEPCTQYVESFGKVFINGEHGFYSKPSKFIQAYDTMTCAGALVWGFRPHADNGGFVVHSEGNEIFSYHFPGWKNQTDSMFDVNEYEIVKATYEASFKVMGKEVPPMPTPHMPTKMNSTTINGTVSLVWRGAAWAEHYELWAGPNGGEYSLVSDNILDNVAAGQFYVPIQPLNSTAPVYMPYKKTKPPIDRVLWIDTKWSVGNRGPGGFKSWHNRVAKGVKRRSHHKKPKINKDDKKGRHRVAQTPRVSPDAGAWYTTRGVAVNGVPGPFSAPVYVADVANVDQQT